MENTTNNFSPPSSTPTSEVQEAFPFLLATAMHEGGNPRLGKFELLNLASGFPAKRTLFVTATPRCQKTTRPQEACIKLPTMELAKLTKSLLSHRQERFEPEGLERHRGIQWLPACQMRENEYNKE